MPKYSQNFLKDTRPLPQILSAASLNVDDTVIEIGPGRGVLTKKLCQVAKRVIAIEIDEKLVSNLIKQYQTVSNIEIIHADFCRFNWRELVRDGQFKIVANIPYHISGLIVRTIFDSSQKLPTDVVLMMQYELAKKIVTKTTDRTVLSNLIELFGQPKIVSKVSKTCFRPVPKVDSAIIAINNIKKPDIENFDEFFPIIKIGFSQRRKTILNNLSHGLKLDKPKTREILQKANIDPIRRAQTLSLEEWKRLYLNMKKRL
ncbi:ribosomal RNA small subunit methyltransferase A [Patescibacteria group bacterium]|nr:ribosomal RNA small subunit methyltransferase A [Patescibacteria group bacterium]